MAASMGFSAQSGLPQNNRVGDFDAFALPTLMKLTGKSLTEVLAILASQGGLMGLSGTTGDMRDVNEAAAAGNPRAKLALDVFAANTRHYLGAYLVELGGADVIVFTGGIGENRPSFLRDDLRESGGVGDRPGSGAERVGQGRGQNQCPAEPRADLGHSHERGNHRRPAGRTIVVKGLVLC